MFYNFKEDSQEKNDKLDSFATQIQTLTIKHQIPTQLILIKRYVYSIYSINILPSATYIHDPDITEKHSSYLPC